MIEEWRLVATSTDREWVFWPDRVTARIDRAVRSETGASASKHWDNLKAGEWGVDSILAVLYAAEQQAGSRTSFAVLEALLPDKAATDQLRFEVGMIGATDSDGNSSPE